MLLLPARKVAASSVDHLLEHGEQLEQLRRNGRAAALVGQAHAQVLLDREPREDLAALRDEADAGPGPVVRRGLVDRLAFEFDAAALDGHEAHERLQQRGLAYAVAAEQDRDLAERGFEAHVSEDVGAAVILVDVLDCQHGGMLSLVFIGGTRCAARRGRPHCAGPSGCPAVLAFRGVSQNSLRSNSCEP
ncbi:hypothetical protein D9M72_522100 [compost metagenome]